MNCGRENNPTYHTSIPLDANVAFKTPKTTWESLTLSVIMEYFLCTLKHQRYIECRTLEP